MTEPTIEIDLVGTIVDQLAAQKGLQPTPVESPEQQRERLRARVQGLLDGYDREFAAGLEILAHRTEGEGAEVAGRWLSKKDDLDAFVKALAADWEASFQPLLASTTALYDKDDLHAAKSALAVLVGVYPLEPEPYVLLGSIVWRQNGLAAAATYYDALLQAMEHPVLNYFAADVFFNGGDRDRARELLKRARVLCDEQPEPSAKFRPLIEDYLAELEG
jgi:hypothetical protein